MKFAALALLFVFVQQKNIFHVVLDGVVQTELFPAYENHNFRQVVIGQGKLLRLEIERRAIDWALLDNPLIVSNKKLKTLSGEVQSVFKQIVSGRRSEREFFFELINFLKSEISYEEDGLTEDTRSILIRKTANCVGYCNLTSDFLDLIGIKSRGVSGFYLKSEANNEPVPHRWLEIILRGGKRFFFDPQTQDFSGTYLLLNSFYRTEQVKRFAVRSLEIKKQISQ